MPPLAPAGAAVAQHQFPIILEWKNVSHTATKSLVCLLIFEVLLPSRDLSSATIMSSQAKRSAVVMEEKLGVAGGLVDDDGSVSVSGSVEGAEGVVVGVETEAVGCVSGMEVGREVDLGLVVQGFLVGFVLLGCW